MSEQTVRVQFIDGSERVVPAKDFHWVGEEGAQSAIALVDGREVPIYRRAEPEWGNKWVEQMDYEEWKKMAKQQKDVSTDYQKRAELLEELVRDCLLELKEVAPYAYAVAPRCIDLQNRAAELGIIPELGGKTHGNK